MRGAPSHLSSQAVSNELFRLRGDEAEAVFPHIPTGGHGLHPEYEAFPSIGSEFPSGSNLPPFRRFDSTGNPIIPSSDALPSYQEQRLAYLKARNRMLREELESEEAVYDEQLHMLHTQREARRLSSDQSLAAAAAAAAPNRPFLEPYRAYPYRGAHPPPLSVPHSTWLSSFRAPTTLAAPNDLVDPLHAGFPLPPAPPIRETSREIVAPEVASSSLPEVASSSSPILVSSASPVSSPPPPPSSKRKQKSSNKKDTPSGSPKETPKKTKPSKNGHTSIVAAQKGLNLQNTLTGRKAMILYMACDDEHLSEYQCFLRKNIEIFEADHEDLQWNAQRMNHAVVLGQVGIRCRHCSTTNPWARAKGAVYYPKNMDGLYQAGQNMSKNHFCDTCTVIPSDVRQLMMVLRRGKRRLIGGGKDYWSVASGVMGVFEDEHGLRFKKNDG